MNAAIKIANVLDWAQLNKIDLQHVSIDPRADDRDVVDLSFHHTYQTQENFRNLKYALDRKALVHDGYSTLEGIATIQLEDRDLTLNIKYYGAYECETKRECHFIGFGSAPEDK